MLRLRSERLAAWRARLAAELGLAMDGVEKRGCVAGGVEGRGRRTGCQATRRLERGREHGAPRFCHARQMPRHDLDNGADWNLTVEDGDVFRFHADAAVTGRSADVTLFRRAM